MPGNLHRRDWHGRHRQPAAAVKPPTPHTLPLAQARERKFHAARLSASDRNLPGCRAAIIRRSTGVRPFRHPDKPRPTATARAGCGRHCRGGHREPEAGGTVARARHRPPTNHIHPASLAHSQRVSDEVIEQLRETPCGYAPQAGHSDKQTRQVPCERNTAESPH